MHFNQNESEFLLGMDAEMQSLAFENESIIVVEVDKSYQNIFGPLQENCFVVKNLKIYILPAKHCYFHHIIPKFLL